MIRRYSEEKHQSLWGAVCDYMAEAGCPINEQEAVPEYVQKDIATTTIYCANEVEIMAHFSTSGNGVLAVHSVNIKVAGDEVE